MVATPLTADCLSHQQCYSIVWSLQYIPAYLGSIATDRGATESMATELCSSLCPDTDRDNRLAGGRDTDQERILEFVKE